MNKLDNFFLKIINKRFSVWLGFMVVAMALFTGVATFLVLSGLTSIVPNHDIVVMSLIANGIMVLFLLGVIFREIYVLIRERRKQSAASRLHVHVVGFFSAIAAFPAILVAIVASITLDQGLDKWFSNRTRGIVETSSHVVQIYVREQGQALKSDILSLASDLNKVMPVFELDKSRYQNYLTAQANARKLSTIAILQQDLTEIIKAKPQITESSLKNSVRILPPPEAILKAESGDVVLIAPGETDQVGGIVKIAWPSNSQRFVYLYIARIIEPQVAQSLREVELANIEYRILQQRRSGVQLAFALMYVSIALIVLLSAIWLGLHFANRMVSPIRRLIYAADQVARGNFYVSVPINSRDGDFASLGKSFNTMTAELREQHDELTLANKSIDERRRFTEAVLSGVPVGVIGLNVDHQVTLVNSSALLLLGIDDEIKILGMPISTIAPELTLLSQEIIEGKLFSQSEVQMVVDGIERTLIARIAADTKEDFRNTYVLTLDDITTLVTAQRMSAWSDVARRIAHEIKNPLTPIQLSAERLRRKYSKIITEDTEIFNGCIDTIVRQVGDIGRMVDEFSSFARMPKPVMKCEDISDLVRQSIFLARVGYSNIAFTQNLPEQKTFINIDRRLISQALTNLLKNAAEAIEGMGVKPKHPEIHVSVFTCDAQLFLNVIDNGCGFPVENRERLLEPYMTTREKGTGLGLAIVRRIVEEHSGEMYLRDASSSLPRFKSGAAVSIILPLELIN